MSSLMGDFNINLLNSETDREIISFFNTMQSNFFAPYVLQPTIPSTKTLIDNIFVSSIDYNSYSGNLTIDISDHLFQFALLEGFHKDIMVNIRNYKNFNEVQFGTTINNTDWDNIL